jgi:hypothetical protein
MNKTISMTLVLLGTITSVVAVLIIAKTLEVRFGCGHSEPAPTPAIRAALVADPSACSGGGDDTARVQAAMAAGTCLPPGTYNVDAPPLGPTGRRRDAMLSGGTLCGVRSAQTTVLFRGDAHRLFWVGVADADVHDVRLDSSCLSDTIEQTHPSSRPTSSGSQRATRCTTS